MSIRRACVVVACVGMVAASWGRTAGAQDVVGGDPRIDGVLPHVLPAGDPYILSDPKTLKLPSARPLPPVRVTPTPTASAPASTAASTSAPATGPETGPVGPEAIPVLTPEGVPVATASAPASAPAAAATAEGPRAETAIAVKFVAYDETVPTFPLKMELTNNSGKDLSRIQGSIFFKDADGKVVYLTGYTADFRTPMAAGKVSTITLGKPNSDAAKVLKESPEKLKVSFQASILKDKDGTEEKF
jgi:hypothetical protein